MSDSVAEREHANKRNRSLHVRSPIESLLCIRECHSTPGAHSQFRLKDESQTVSDGPINRFKVSDIIELQLWFISSGLASSFESVSRAPLISVLVRPLRGNADRQRKRRTDSRDFQAQ